MVKGSRMPDVQTAMARLQALPFTLSSGLNLVDWLIRRRGYAPYEASRAREEYQRFLALAMTAPAGEATLPGPHIAELWQVHRADREAYVAFTEALGCKGLEHIQPRQSLLWDRAWPRTLARYSEAFGSPPAPWWPSLSRLWLQAGLVLTIYLHFASKLWGWMSGTANAGLGSGTVSILLSLYFIIGWQDNLFTWPNMLFRRSQSPKAAP